VLNSNSFGLLPRITIFGQSHDPEIGVVIDGLPAGIALDMNAIHALLGRRRPGQSNLMTPREETDEPCIETGIKDGVTTGQQMRVTFKNSDTQSRDYEQFKTIPRPSHADYIATQKYGEKHDIAGGGRFSGRLTLPLCFAGAVCMQILRDLGIEIQAELDEVEGVRENLEERIIRARKDKDSVGGVVELIATGLPQGVGEHPFCGVEPMLSQILFAIPGVRGVEFGAGFKATYMRGSEHNDCWVVSSEGSLETATNNTGGVVAGMTTGMPLVLRVAFKPTPSIGRPQVTANLATGQPEELVITGRHDPCIAIRAVPVVEAAVAIGLLTLINLDSAQDETPASTDDELAKLRKEIDAIDVELIRLLNQRMSISNRIGMSKMKQNMRVHDSKREKEIIERVREGASPEDARYIEEIYTKIFEWSRERQEL
jgi:chorismate synthase